MHYDCLTSKLLSKIVGNGKIENVQRAADFIARHMPEKIHERQARGENGLALTRPEEALLTQMTTAPTRREALFWIMTGGGMTLMAGSSLGGLIGAPIIKEAIADMLSDPARNVDIEQRKTLEHYAEMVNTLEECCVPLTAVAAVVFIGSLKSFLDERTKSTGIPKLG